MTKTSQQSPGAASTPSGGDQFGVDLIGRLCAEYDTDNDGKFSVDEYVARTAPPPSEHMSDDTAPSPAHVTCSSLLGCAQWPPEW